MDGEALQVAEVRVCGEELVQAYEALLGVGGGAGGDAEYRAAEEVVPAAAEDPMP